MASTKLAAAALAVVLACAALAATEATAYAQPPYQFEPEPCKTQAMYFKNCLLRGHGKKCCFGVVANPACYCEVEMECAPGHYCSRADKKVKIEAMKLSCMQNLPCKRA